MKLKPIAVLTFIIIGIVLGITLVKYRSNFNKISQNGLSDSKTETNSLILDDSWQIFRGNSALSGIASGRLPDVFELRWKYKTDGPIKSSAVIQNGHVFIGSDDGKIYALKLDSGKEVWNFETEDSVEAPPCIWNDSVFVGSVDSFLYALDAKTGKLKWKYQTEDKIIGAANWTFSPSGEKAWILV